MNSDSGMNWKKQWKLLELSEGKLHPEFDLELLEYQPLPLMAFPSGNHINENTARQ
jgi:hypothetical protein